MEDDAMMTVKRAIIPKALEESPPAGLDEADEYDTAIQPSAATPFEPEPPAVEVPNPAAIAQPEPPQMWPPFTAPMPVAPPVWPSTPDPVAPPPWISDILSGPAGFSSSRSISEEDEMADIQWEYCRLQLDSGMYSQKPAVGRYPYFVRIFIDYYGSDVPPTLTFGEDTDQIDRPSKLWGRIVGQMGMANWEMINVYPGSNKDLSLVNVMAYFKRPAQSGRRVDEPKIAL